MGRNLLDLIQSKIELFRLEQRYTKRRHRRSTFVSDAIYVDGEYVYAQPSPTKRHSVAQFPSQSSSSVDTEFVPSPTMSGTSTNPYRSSMPGYGSNNPYRREFVSENEFRGEQHEKEGQFGSFGSLEKQTTGRKSRWGSVRMLGKRRSMVTVQEVRWEDHAGPMTRDY
jgi:hypothetical protein